MQLTRDDIIENSKYRNAKDYGSTTKVVALAHHEHAINELFDYIEHIENEWFTTKELLSDNSLLKNRDDKELILEWGTFTKDLIAKLSENENNHILDIRELVQEYHNLLRNKNEKQKN